MNGAETVQVRFHELIGMQVVDARGERLGRIAELVAQRRGDALCVTAVRIGPAALLQRVGARKSAWLGAPAQQIPWALVAAIDERRLRLRVAADELTAAAGREPVDERDPGEPVGEDAP
jgi:sporulation protein YlmC with PRC-barrel domain